MMLEWSAGSQDTQLKVISGNKTGAQFCEAANLFAQTQQQNNAFVLVKPNLYIHVHAWCTKVQITIGVVV